ncbi:hypothetical protein [Loktanella sp. SALINAS62]|uniref:hypothetical protein n=1 Tax=Loktanella sp. SALINAS62 TaxID=2706124 RepID=UPI001B8BC898|nr:hypothetical protein [Loktanella sp. SALINAS62]MBS1303040.1 hypothetical protein [Loktanella sp. SALINAS62]
MLRSIAGNLVSGLVGGAVVWIVLSFGQIRLPGATRVLETATLHMTYSNFLAVSLTAVTVALAVVATVIGLAAFYTYGAIEKKIQERASAALDEVSIQVETRVEEVLDDLPNRVAGLVYGTRRRELEDEDEENG